MTIVVGSTSPGTARKLTSAASITVDYYCQQLYRMISRRRTYKYREAIPLAIQLVDKFLPSRFDHSPVYPNLMQRIAVKVRGVK